MTQEIPEITLRRLIEREIDNVMKCSSCHETLSELERVWSFAGSATDRAPLTDVVVSMVRPKTSRFHGNIDIDRRLDGIKDEYDRSEDDYSIEKHWSCHNCGEEVDIEEVEQQLLSMTSRVKDRIQDLDSQGQERLPIEREKEEISH